MMSCSSRPASLRVASAFSRSVTCSVGSDEKYESKMCANANLGSSCVAFRQLCSPACTWSVSTFAKPSSKAARALGERVDICRMLCACCAHACAEATVAITNRRSRRYVFMKVRQAPLLSFERISLIEGQFAVHSYNIDTAGDRIDIQQANCSRRGFHRLKHRVFRPYGDKGNASRVDQRAVFLGLHVADLLDHDLHLGLG